MYVDGVIGAEAIQGARKVGKKKSGNGVEKTEGMNACGGYRTESFVIIVWKRYDKTIKRHTLAKGPGDTRYNTSIILHTRYHVSMEFTEW